MPLSLYQQLFGSMQRLGIRSLSISGGGEPLIDPRCEEIMALAHDAGLMLRIVTNGTRLGQGLLSQIVKAREIRFSLNAARRETYAALKQTAPRIFDQVMAHLAQLLAQRALVESPLEVGVTFLISEENVAEALAFAEQMLLLDVDQIIFKYDIFAIQAIPSTQWESLRRDMVALGQEAREQGTRLVFRDRHEMTMEGLRCFIPHLKVAVDPFGGLHSCCLGAQPEETNGALLGDLREQSLEAIWRESRPLRTRLRQQQVHCTACNHTDYRINRAMMARGEMFT